ncbi:MAG: cytochrome c oxidase subunit 2 [Candidatus Hydrogenedentota bacterium]
MSHLQLIPEQASTFALKVDLLFYGLLALSVFFFGAVTLMVAFLSIRYRKGSNVDRGPMDHSIAKKLELTWTIVPTILALAFFGWSAYVFYDFTVIPEGSMDVLVTGKQWMWKVQHPNGKREINHLHVPVNTPVRLTMTSEDVIHSFFIPVFRLKRDVLPNRYTTMGFTATKPGTYHLFCAEYCGTEHSKMIGKVIVMEEGEYEKWLADGTATTPAVPAASGGEQLFMRMGCANCHNSVNTARGPQLSGLFGKEVSLTNGEKIVADENYIRESIVNPQSKLVVGYPPLMPTFKNQMKEEDLYVLVDYIKSLEAAGASSAQRGNAS